MLVDALLHAEHEHEAQDKGDADGGVRRVLVQVLVVVLASVAWRMLLRLI